MTIPVRRQRADGIAEIIFCGNSGVSRLRHLQQTWPCRVLFPSVLHGQRPEVVIANTSGGMVAGDYIGQSFAVQGGAGATITTQAAEKIYRSDGAICKLSTTITAEHGCELEWMPQETILFEGARLRRYNKIFLHSKSVFIAGEITIFGRGARGETFEKGQLYDNWEVHIDDNIVWADKVGIDAGLNAALRHPCAYGDSTAVALIVAWAADPVEVREQGRVLMQGNFNGGFTIVNGLVIGRFVSSNAGKLRKFYSKLWIGLRQSAGLTGSQIPRVWNL